MGLVRPFLYYYPAEGFIGTKERPRPHGGGHGRVDRREEAVERIQPSEQGGGGEVDALAQGDLADAVQGEVVDELGDDQEGEKRTVGAAFFKGALDGREGQHGTAFVPVDAGMGAAD